MRKKKQIWDFKNSLIEDSKAPSFYNIVVLEKDLVSINSTKNILSKFLNFELITTPPLKESVSNETDSDNCELVCGFYTKDIAETKLKEITDFATRSKRQINLLIRKFIE